MNWLWTDWDKNEAKVITCTVGQVSFFVHDGEVTSIGHWSFRWAEIETWWKYTLNVRFFSFQDGTVTMELLWTEDDLFNSVNCNAWGIFVTTQFLKWKKNGPKWRTLPYLYLFVLSGREGINMRHPMYDFLCLHRQHDNNTCCIPPWLWICLPFHVKGQCTCVKTHRA